MKNEATLSGIYLEERHPVDDALGCMIPVLILGDIAIFGMIKLVQNLLFLFK